MSSESTTSPAPEIRKLDLTKLDTSIQTRSEIRTRAVAEYSKIIKEQREDGNKAKFPAPIVYEVGDRLLLACGHHRVRAHLLAGVTELECEVRQGNELDAIKAGVEENSRQGERLTLADRRHTMTLVLKQHESLSNRALAEICDVSEGTIRNWRGKVKGAQSSQVRTGRDGKSYPAVVATPSTPPQKPHFDHSDDTAAEHMDPDDGCDSIEFPDEGTAASFLPSPSVGGTPAPQVATEEIQKEAQKLLAKFMSCLFRLKELNRPLYTDIEGLVDFLSKRVERFSGTATEQTPADSSPSTKSYGLRLLSAQKALGGFASAIAKLKTEDPISYKDTRSYIEDLDGILNRWRKPAA